MKESGGVLTVRVEERFSSPTTSLTVVLIPGNRNRDTRSFETLLEKKWVSFSLSHNGFRCQSRTWS